MRTKPYYFILLLLLISCEDLTNNKNEDEVEVVFHLEPRLDQDSNGYYHLQLDSTRFQSLHRISGHIYGDGEPLENIKFNWTSSHYWVLGDSVGYIIDVWNCYHGDCDEPWESPTYIGLDTVYVTYFGGMEVPTINCCSYSNSEGEVNTMFGPVWTMRYDTVLMSVGYFTDYTTFVSQSIEIVLD